MVPVSVRTQDERGTLGNRVTQINAPIPVHLPDPAARLDAVRVTLAGLKESRQALGGEVLTAISEWAVPNLLVQAVRLAARVRPYNLVVTNVPGPQIPLYLAAAAGILVLDRMLAGPASRAALALQHAVGGLRVRSVAIPGFTIAYLDGGSGEPLVLVHGIGADKDNFAPIVPWLRGVGRVIALDLPGFGESSKPMDGDYSIDAQAGRLGQFLDALALPRVHLAGSSMG